jgi:hypothetical protein
MSGAASKLGVSQPVMSDAIADREATVGVRLLDRSRSGVTPTIYGQALLRRGQVAFDELQQGIREIEHLTDPADTLSSARAGAACRPAVGSPANHERRAGDRSVMLAARPREVDPPPGGPMLAPWHREWQRRLAPPVAHADVVSASIGPGRSGVWR